MNWKNSGYDTKFESQIMKIYFVISKSGPNELELQSHANVLSVESTEHKFGYFARFSTIQHCHSGELSLLVFRPECQTSSR